MGRMKDYAIDMGQQQQLDDDYDEYCGTTEQQQKQQEEEEMWAERKWEAEREDAINLGQEHKDPPF